MDFGDKRSRYGVIIMAHFRAWDINIGIVFGMDIKKSTAAFKAMKHNIKDRDIVGQYGISVNVLTVPARYVSAIMGMAGWLVSERKALNKFSIDGEEEIYIDYDGDVIIGGESL